jgi:hypothetical protein
VPLFVLIGRDGASGAALRREHRSAHLAHLRPLAEKGRVRFAGPLRDEHGEPVGSVVVFEAEDRAAARAIVADDPYVARGVFATAELHETIQVLPDAEPART